MMKKTVLFSVILLISSEAMAMTSVGDYYNWLSNWNWRWPSLSMPSGFSNYIPSWSSVTPSKQNAAIAAALVTAGGLGYGGYKYWYEPRLRVSLHNKIVEAKGILELNELQQNISTSILLSNGSKKSLLSLINSKLQQRQNELYNTVLRFLQERFLSKGLPFTLKEAQGLKAKISQMPLDRDRKDELYEFIKRRSMTTN